MIKFMIRGYVSESLFKIYLRDRNKAKHLDTTSSKLLMNLHMKIMNSAISKAIREDGYTKMTLSEMAVIKSLYHQFHDNDIEDKIAQLYNDAVQDAVTYVKYQLGLTA